MELEGEARTEDTEGTEDTGFLNRGSGGFGQRLGLSANQGAANGGER
jgi:hypothetical protein